MSYLIQTFFLSAFFYFLLPFFVISGVTFLIRKLKIKKYQNDRVELKNALDVLPLSMRVSRMRKFAFKESPQKVLFFVLNVVLFFLNVLFFYEHKFFLGVLYAFFVPLFFNIFLWALSNKTLKERDFNNEKIFELKRQKMGLSNRKSTPTFHDEEFLVTEYEKENLSMPKKLRLFIPVGYNDYYRNVFLDSLTQMFGSKKEWVVDTLDESFPGWDMAKSVASLVANDCLPEKAPWSEKYVLNEKVAWSFFPLGIGTHNGLILEDPETGEEVHVLGYDVAGAQVALAKKHKMTIGDELLSPSPHALVAGKTGGGKALSLDTEVFVFEPVPENPN